MMELTMATVALAFKEAFYTAAKQFMADDMETQHVHVCFGQPATLDPAEIISFGSVGVGQEVATMGTNRAREETITLDVQLSVIRGGAEEAEIEASRRCYDLLRMLEYYVRVTDTTVGGTVRECFLTSHDSPGATPEEVMHKGRMIDVTATFTAKARIRN